MRVETFTVLIILEEEKRDKRGNLGFGKKTPLLESLESALLEIQGKGGDYSAMGVIVWRVERDPQLLLGFSSDSTFVDVFTCSWWK